MHRAAAASATSSVWESRGRAPHGKGHPRAPSTAGTPRTDSRSRSEGSPRRVRPLTGMLSSPTDLFQLRDSERCWGCPALRPGSSGCGSFKCPPVLLQRGRASSSGRRNVLLHPLGAILSFPLPLKYARETCVEGRLLLPQG